MNAQDLEQKVWEKAQEFGIKTQENSTSSPNAIWRSNIKSDAFNDGKAYFGYIRPEEAHSGSYFDMSFVVFPQQNGGPCIVSIVVGSAGFQRDYDLAAMAGSRRLFARLTSADGNSFIKNSFTDNETSFRDLKKKLTQEDNLNNLKNVVGVYEKCIMAARIVDPDSEDGFKVIAAWLAQYAKLRHWGTKPQIQAQNRSIEAVLNTRPIDILSDARRLIKTRRYVVLQGAPGTGKTYSALKLSEDYSKTHFIQFHAETTYQDFVEGIRPKLNDTNLSYESVKGELVLAIESALELKPQGKRVLLIIDEINRANLSNVLGPVFYLFEDQVENRQVKLKVGELELEKLPDNLDVIATMNTADRSLAVVDFALRRRFVWYTIRPQEIRPNTNQVFHKDLFLRFSETFELYASDQELNLQPGPSYFLTPQEGAEQIMKDRLVYELLPLIKEYLDEGLMHNAADSFSNLFFETTGKYLYE